MVPTILRLNSETSSAGIQYSRCIRARDLGIVAAEVLTSDLEAQNVPSSAVPGVPISRDLNRILLFEYRIKDGLIRKTRRKGFPSTVADQNQFGFPDGPKQHNRIHS